MHLSYSTIAARSAELTASEAITLCTAAARASSGGARVLPSPEHIRLSRVGVASITGPALTGSESERVAGLAALLRRLLDLDGHGAAISRADVPGALLLVLARVDRHIDLPVPSYSEFIEVLERLGSSDPRVLAALYRRFVPAARRSRMAGLVEPVAASLVGLAAAAAFFTIAWRDRDLPAASSAAAGSADVARAAPADDLGTAALPASMTDREGAPGADAAGRAGGAPGQAVNAAADQTDAARAISRAAPLLSAAQVGADVFSPSFAARDELLFHAGRQRGTLMRASFGRDGAPHLATILQDGSANYHAVPSPDGRWLAFDSDRDGVRAVYIASRDATESRRISGEGYAAVPRWSPDGSALAFVRADAARPHVWNVWVADVNTGELRRVSRHQVGQAWSASWFPDGRRLAYSVEDRLVIADLRSGARRILRSPVDGRLVRTPAVSPDGASIVFQVHRDGVWLLDVSAGRMRRVLADPAAEEFAWSPDGSQIVYHTRRQGAWSLWQLSFTRS